MKVIRLIWKSCLIFAVITFFLISAAIACVYIFRDKIIGILISEINKKLATEIKVGEIDLNPLDKFPYLSLKFKEVNIKGSGNLAKADLAQAQTIYFTFNPIDIFQENYQIEQIYLENAVVNIVIDKEGKGNYQIFKADTTASQTSLDLNLKKINLKEVTVNLTHEPGNQYYNLLSHDVTARLKLVQEVYNIALDGKLHASNITIAGQSYISEKDIELNSSLEYSQKQKYVQILPSHLLVESSGFNLEGRYDFNGSNFINLKFEGEKGKVQTLLALLPKSINSKLSSYKSTGNIFFKGAIKGRMSETENPQITIDFGFENASFTHPQTNGRFEKANLKGYFTNGAQKHTTSSILNISKFDGYFQGNPISGALMLSNFTQPYIQFSCKGNIDLASAIKFYPVETVKNLSGTLAANLQFKGSIADIKDKPENIEASGEIALSNTNLELDILPYKFSGISGDFLFNKNDVSVSELKGFADNSDFRINGFFKNLIASLFYKHEKMIVQADFYSSSLDLDALHALNLKSSSSEKSSSQDILNDFRIELDCQIDKLKYQKISIKDLKGRLVFNNPELIFNQVGAKLCGGEVHFDSKVKFADKTEVYTKIDYKNLLIDSLFYVFNNFEQDFLTDKNLKGALSGNADLYVPVNKTNDLIYPEIIGKVKLSIKDGQLNGFEPMQKLSRFIDEQELYNVRFSELSNEFIIKDNKLSIPEMTIKSNISNIAVLGTHSFDNFLDYKLTIPLKNFKKKDKDEAFGAIEDDGRGYSRIFLTLYGPANNFKIAYDSKRTRQKLKQDLKEEVVEITDIFRKGKLKDKAKEQERQQTREATVNPNETFDF